MSKYDYECVKCGQMEIEHSIKLDAMTICPKCGGKEFKRIISKTAGVLFKGTGFYETDYKIKKGEPK